MASQLNRFDGRVVIVTGGGTGIGAGIGRRFASEGAHVLLVGRRGEPLERTASSITDDGGSVAWRSADVSVPDEALAAVDTAHDRWGRVDVVVNSAGTFTAGHVLELDPVEWARVIDTNLSACLYTAQTAAKHMVAQGRGAIITVSSIDGMLGEASNAAYNTTKTALYGLTRSLAIDLGPFGVTANAVSPGYTDGTPMAEATAVDPAALEHMRARWDRVPSRRMVTVSEIAGTCAFLASDDGTGVNGANIVVDGGTTAALYAMESVPGTAWAKEAEAELARVRAGLCSS